MRQGLRAQDVLGRQAPYRLSHRSNELNYVQRIVKLIPLAWEGGWLMSGSLEDPWLTSFNSDRAI